MTVKKLREIIRDLPDDIEVSCLVSSYGVIENVWSIDNHYVAHGDCAGLYLLHERNDWNEEWR